jgi:urease accessory protein
LTITQNQDKNTQTVKGHLHLGFKYNQSTQHTKLMVYEQQPPLKVIRAFPVADGGALVHLHNLSGGVLGGDQLSLTVEVEKDAYVQLTSTSATRLYRSRPHMPTATQTTTIRVGEGGLLEYLPDPLIPFAGSRYQQRTQIELAEDAGLLWWEIVSPGRVAHGERFAYEMLHLISDIQARDKPIAIERLRLEPHCQALASSTRLGTYSYFCSFYICRVGIAAAQWSSLEKRLQEVAEGLTRPGESYWGVSALVTDGLMIRALSQHGHILSSGLLTFWQVAKQALYGRAALPPRKIY